MKHILLLSISVLYLAIAQGQLNKKTWLVGGSGSFYSYKQDFRTITGNAVYKITNIEVSTSLGYFILEKFAVGLRPSFSSEKTKGISSSSGLVGSGHTERWAIGPFARYYFLEKNKSFNILADISYQLGQLIHLGAMHEKGKNNNLSVMAGTEIFFNTSAGLEILLGYSDKIFSIENSPGEFSNEKKGFQVSVGFVLHLEKN